MDSIKGQNKATLHESNQIKNAINYFNGIISDEVNDDNVKNLKLLNQLYMFSDTRLKTVFGNNLVNTKLPLIVVKLLTNFNAEKLKTPTGLNLLYLCLSCLWNATDCSEKICANLVETSEFKSIICTVFKKCDLNKTMETQMAQAIISIIHNITRRQKLGNSFQGHSIESRIIELTARIDDSTIKVVCLVVLLQVMPTVAEAARIGGKMYDSIAETVVCYLDGTSNNDDYRSEGFSGKEVLEMIKSLSRIESLRKYFQDSTTLNATFIRFLGKQYQIKLVTDVIWDIYEEKEIAALLDVYKDKNRDVNEEVIKSLTKKDSFS